MRSTGVLALVAGLAVFCSRAVGLPAGYDWQEWPVNGHFYALTQTCGELEDGIGSWLEAEGEAVAIGGHLVTINNDVEQDWLNLAFPRDPSRVGRYSVSDPEFWIGLWQDPDHLDYREPGEPQLEPPPPDYGGWVWISGEPVTYTNWNAGEPNDGLGNPLGEMYGEMHQHVSGGWNDMPPDMYDLPPGTSDARNIQLGIIEIIPEPATLSLLVLGGLAAIRRRR